MASIGKTSLQIEANAQGLEQGLKRAEERIKAFASKTSAIANSGFSARSIAGPAQAIAASVPVFGGALSSIAGGFASAMESAEEYNKKVLQTAREANRLGLSYNSLLAIEKMAGRSSEEMDVGMRHFSKTLGEVRFGSSEAADKFRKLGLSGETLANMPLAQALGSVMDRVRAMENPYERAALVTSLFGKSSFELITILQKGSPALAAWNKHIQEMGTGRTPGQIKQIADNAAQLKEYQEKTEAMNAQVGGGIGGWVQGSLAGLNRGIGWAATMAVKPFDWEVGHDYGPDPRAAERRSQGLAEEKARIADLANAIAEREKALRKEADAFRMSARDALVWELKQKGATDSQLEGVKTLAKQLEELDKVKKMINAPVQAFGSVDELHERLRSLQKARKEATAGWRGAGFDTRAAPFDQAIKELFEKHRLGVDAASAQAFKDTRTPLEAAQSRLKDIGELDNAQVRARSMAALANDLIAGAGVGGPVRLPGALEQGSSASISAINQFQSTPVQSQADLLREAVDLLKTRSQQDDRNSAELIRVLKEAFGNPADLIG